MEHELYDKIVQEARSINIHFNAIFDLKTFIILSESFILAVASGTVCAIKCLGVSFIKKFWSYLYHI